MAAVYRVTCPLVVARDETGSLSYHYEGALVPGSIAKAEVDRLVEGGFIEKLPEAEPEVKAPVKK